MYILVIKRYNHFYFELEMPVQSDNRAYLISNCLFRFRYLLEGNLQQYFVSTVSSTYVAFNSL